MQLTEDSHFQVGPAAFVLALPTELLRQLSWLDMQSNIHVHVTRGKVSQPEY